MVTLGHVDHTEVLSVRSFSTTYFSAVLFDTVRFFAGGSSVDDDSCLFAHACPDIHVATA